MSATLTTLVSFNVTDGQRPYFENLIADAAGDLFGTTEAGGANNDGTVFELIKTDNGYSAPITLVSFNVTNGEAPVSSLIADAAGDLFGTTVGGGAGGDGTVFELIKTDNGYSAPATLGSFNGTNGAAPYSSLTADAAGDLFGTTLGGGASGYGTVFELIKTDSGYSAPTTLVSFNGTNGESPVGGLIADAAGDLFGITELAGASGYGTVFELIKTDSGYSAPTTLLSFNGTNGGYAIGSLIADAAGDLFGITQYGGTSGYGTVFELTKTLSGYSAPITLVSFNGGDGSYPTGSLIADAAGDLFGTTEEGGASGYGTVFEITKTDNGYGTLTTLVSFNYTNGAYPLGTLIADAAGDLFGTTEVGGVSGDGTVFEITSSGFVFSTSSAPSISGTKAGQTTTSEASVTPFAGVTIADTNSNATDTLTITLSGVGGTLTGNGLTGGTGGVYNLTGTAAAITAELDALNFTPTAGAPNTASTTTFALSDQSSAFATPATDSTISVIDTDPAVAPSISGTKAGQTTTSEASVTPFAGVTIADTNSNATDTLTITLSGVGGTLTGNGLTGGAGGVYNLTGTAATITAALDTLSFTPTAGAPNTTSTTTFALSDQSSAFATPATDSTTAVIDIDPAVAPSLSGTKAGQTTTDEATIQPLSGVTVVDASVGGSEVVMITLTAGGVASDANGILSGTGLTKTGVGTYLLAAGSPSVVTTELDALVFAPTAHEVSPGQAVTTGLTISASQLGLTTNDTTTSVIATAVNDKPVIGGTKAGQTTTDYIPIKPFTAATISDVDVGTSDSLTIVLKNSVGIGTDANGTLSGVGLTKTGTGTYTLAATSPAALTAELEALTFTPTQHQVAAGQTVTTSFTLIASQTAGASTVTATDATSSVVTTALDYIKGPVNGFGLISGTTGTDVITANGYFNVIYSNGGNDFINAGLGNAIVSAAGGNDVIILNGRFNVVTGGNGNDTVSGSLGNTSVSLGNGNDIVQIGGSNDVVKLGNGNNLVTCAQGLAFITTGSGNDTIVVGGYGNTVNAGGGTNTITGGQGNDTFVLPGEGQGFDTITGFTETNGDTLNLQAALAATSWNHQSITLGNYLKVTNNGGNTTLSIASTGIGAGIAVAQLNGSGNLGLSDLISHHSLIT